MFTVSRKINVVYTYLQLLEKFMLLTHVCQLLEKFMFEANKAYEKLNVG